MKELPSRNPGLAKCYKIGDLVICTPEYNLGTRSSGASIIYPFNGHGVIVELQWPEKAKILINTGEIVCILLEKLQIIKQRS